MQGIVKYSSYPQFLKVTRKEQDKYVAVTQHALRVQTLMRT